MWTRYSSKTNEKEGLLIRFDDVMLYMTSESSPVLDILSWDGPIYSDRN